MLALNWTLLYYMYLLSFNHIIRGPLSNVRSEIVPYILVVVKVWGVNSVQCVCLCSFISVLILFHFIWGHMTDFTILVIPLADLCSCNGPADGTMTKCMLLEHILLCRPILLLLLLLIIVSFSSDSLPHHLFNLVVVYDPRTVSAFTYS